jgi:hypothetical protein
MRTWLAVAGFENRSRWYWLADNQRSMERATCSTRGVLPARGQQQGARARGIGCSHLLHCGPACRFFPRNLSLIVFGKSLLLQVGVTQKDVAASSANGSWQQCCTATAERGSDVGSQLNQRNSKNLGCAAKASGCALTDLSVTTGGFPTSDSSTTLDSTTVMM